MSYSVKDSIGGKRVQVTYGAAQLPLPLQSGRRRKSRVIRDHLAHNQSRYALVVRSGGDLEYWWVAESAGISFAAAIQAWVLGTAGGPDKPEDPDESEGPDAIGGFLAVIPMDTRVYLAEVAGGLVRNERILTPDRAEGDVAKALGDGTVVYAFSASGSGGTGRAAETIARHVALDELPFDPVAWRYRPSWQVFAGQGLPHPVHAWAGILFAVVIGLAAVSGPAAKQALQNLPGVVGGVMGDMIAGIVDRWWPKDVPVPIGPAEPPVEVVPSVAHTAAADLERLARYLVLAESLYGDGLRDVKVDRTGAVYAGSTLDAGLRSSTWPSRVVSIWPDAGGEWSLDHSGWTVRVSHGPDPETDRPPAMGSGEILRTMMGTSMPVSFRLDAGPEELPGRHDQSENTVTLALNRTTWTATVATGIVGALLDQAAFFSLHERDAGIPAALDHAECSFQDWKVQSCSLRLEINSL